MAKNYSKDKVLASIENSGGFTSVVASKLGCDWGTAKRYIDMWKETKAAHEAQKSKTSSALVGHFMRAIQSGERWAIERGLDTVAKADGLAIVNRTEISGPDGGPIDRIVVEYVDPAKKKKHHDPDG